MLGTSVTLTDMMTAAAVLWSIIIVFGGAYYFRSVLVQTQQVCAICLTNIHNYLIELNYSLFKKTVE